MEALFRFVAAVLIFGVGVLIGAVFQAERGSVNETQAEFERLESRWDWEGMRLRKELTCVDRLVSFQHQRRVLMRTCVLELPNQFNPVAGTRTSFKLAVYACSPDACAWAIEP